MKDVAPEEPALHLEPEACDGLDQDLNGVIDDGEACKRTCEEPSLAVLTAPVILPRITSQTVAWNAGEIPVLNSITEIPAFCGEPIPSAEAGEITVRCGEVLAVGREGLRANKLRVAPGGIVRLEDNAKLAIRDQVLICPEGVIQAGGEGSKTGDAEDAHSLTIEGGTLLHFGSIESRGGAVESQFHGGRVGRSGSIEILVERALVAGKIDASGASHARGYGASLDGGRAGDISLTATRESFLSGDLVANGGNGGDTLGCGPGGAGGQAGVVALHVPVSSGVLVEARGGNAGQGQMFAADTATEVGPGSYARLLCDGQTLVTSSVPRSGMKASIHFGPGSDLDLFLETTDGTLVDASNGLSLNEEVTIPQAGTFHLRIVNNGQPVAVPYTLAIQ